MSMARYRCEFIVRVTIEDDNGPDASRLTDALAEAIDSVLEGHAVTVDRSAAIHYGIPVMVDHD
jgi:hypothetical protein